MLMWKRSDLVNRPTQVPSERSCSRAKLVAVFISRSLRRGGSCVWGADELAVGEYIGVPAGGSIWRVGSE